MALRNVQTGEIVTDDYACFILQDNDGYEDVPNESVFDPADHNVEDVEAYLEAHPEDAARVRAAETAGKARKTLVNADE